MSIFLSNLISFWFIFSTNGSLLAASFKGNFFEFTVVKPESRYSLLVKNKLSSSLFLCLNGLKLSF